MTEPQESELASYIEERLTSLDKDNRARIDADTRSRLRYENDRRDRANAGGIFAQSNTPLPLTSLVVDYFSSKTFEDLLGEKPFFSARPQGPGDRDVSNAIERFARYKLVDQASVDEAFDDSLSSVFLQRAAILKSIYFEDKDTFERTGLNALHSRIDGAPVQISDYGYILEDAEWVQQEDPLLPGTARTHLVADPSFIFDPAQHEFRTLEAPVTFERILYAGPKSVEVKSENFRAPDDLASLDDADFVAEYYDKTADWALDRLLERKWLDAARYETILKTADASAKTGTGKDSSSLGQKHDGDKIPENLSFDTRTKRVQLAECWIRWDVLRTGRPQRIAVWWDKTSKKILFYDYVANISATGRHPFRSICIAKKNGRWWGLSIPEIVEFAQEFIDKQFNRHAFRNEQNATPKIGIQPDAFVGGRDALMNATPYEPVELEPNRTMAEAVQAFMFPNSDLHTDELIDRVKDYVHLWLGISNLSQGDYSDVPQNTTAFGQDATLKESAKLSRRHSRRVGNGLADHLMDLVEIMIATMDEEEVFYYNEGDQSLAGFISADSVRALKLDVQMVMGRASNANEIQANTLAMQLIEKYANMLMTAPWMARIVRPVYKTALRLLGFDDVDQLLPSPDDPTLGLPPPPMNGVAPEGAQDQSVPGAEPAPEEDPASEETADTLPFPGNAANTAAPIVAGPPPVLNRNGAANA